MILGGHEFGARLGGGPAAAVVEHYLREVAPVHDAVHVVAAGGGLAADGASADVAREFVGLPSAHPLHAEQADQLAADVHAFIARIETRVELLGATVIAQNLEQCLAGVADSWNTTELNQTTRVGLRHDPSGVTLWIKHLRQRLRESPQRSMEILMNARYTIQDVRDRKDVNQFL